MPIKRNAMPIKRNAMPMGAERYADEKGPHLAGLGRNAMPPRRYPDGWSHKASCGLPLVLSSIL